MISQFLNFRKQEALAYARNLRDSYSPSQSRVVIFAQGRTGSTLLEDLLSSTGLFKSYGELLNTTEREIVFPAAFIEGLSKRESSRNFIFHVKIYQLTRDRNFSVDPESFLNTLYEKGWHVIYLRRKNKVRHALSNLVAEERDQYHKYDDENEKLILHVDCEDFVRMVNNRFKFEEQEKKVLANIPHFKITYEDNLLDVDQHQETVNKILKFLSLEPEDVSTKHRKVNTQSLDELIANYDEFLKCLEKHHWNHFLD